MRLAVVGQILTIFDMQIIIDTADTKITVKNKSFFIQNASVERIISPKRLTSIAITSNCLLNTAAIKLAAQNQVPILFFNNFGTIQARLWSPYFTNIADIRKKQMIFANSFHATDWVIRLLQIKTNEQIRTLRQLAKKRPQHTQIIEHTVMQMNKIFVQTEDINQQTINKVRQRLMGYEGSISRHYFSGLKLFMPTPFAFDKRSRRPAMDYFNSGLNYLYGMTYSIVESGVFAKGLDPFIGFLHVDFYKRTALVFDLIEPIRPLIDRILVDLIMTEQLLPDHFIPKGQGYWLNKKGKRIIIPSFNAYLQERIKIGHTVRRFKDHIYGESNLLGNHINEIITL